MTYQNFSAHNFSIISGYIPTDIVVFIYFINILEYLENILLHLPRFEQEDSYCIELLCNGYHVKKQMCNRKKIWIFYIG